MTVAFLLLINVFASVVVLIIVTFISCPQRITQKVFHSAAFICHVGEFFVY